MEKIILHMWESDQHMRGEPKWTLTVYYTHYTVSFDKGFFLLFSIATNYGGNKLLQI